MLEVVDHAVDPEEVRVVGVGAVLEKRPERRGIVGRDPLVGVEEHHPLGIERLGRGEQASAVLGVVPTAVRGAHRVLDYARDQRARVEQRSSVVGAPVVERDHDIGEPPDRLEPAAEMFGFVPRGKQAREQRAACRLRRHGLGQ